MRTTSYKNPRDLAHIVATKLRASRGPSADLLEDLFQALFLASLKSEEGTPIRCTLVFCSPMKPDPDPPERVRLDRWVYSPFARSIRLTPASLSKLAPACDPFTTAIAVHARPSGHPSMHGMFDQQRPHQAMLQYERIGGYAPPGLFQAQIAGFGHILVMKDSVVLGELRDGMIAPTTQDVLSSGPVMEFFEPYLEAHLEEMCSLRWGGREDIRDWEINRQADEWMRALRRILVRAQAHHHGASFIFLEPPPGRDLKLQYTLAYDRLRVALEAAALARVRMAMAHAEVKDHLDAGSDSIPVGAYLDDRINYSDLRDAEKTIDGAIEFIASLSRVDGAVLMRPDLTMQGFGTEILSADLAQQVLLSRSTRPRGRAVVDPNRYGTRHRSAMRFCAAHPSAVAFVISEDGPVRAIRSCGGRLWLWDNVQLRDVEDDVRE